MRIWIDALTPKQARLAAALYTRLVKEGYEVLVTARSYDFTESVLRRHGVNYVSVGRHGGESLKGKLEADIERMAALLRIIDEYKPDVLVSYPSPSATRVAFGLSIPIIVFSDSPHSVPPHRLTIPLADVLIHSALVPRHHFEWYVLTRFTRVVSFYGIEEWEWIRGYRCNEGLLEDMGLEPNKYIVLRVPERKAVYYQGRSIPNVNEIVDAIVKNGYQVVIFPRYEDDLQHLRHMVERYPKMVKIVWGEAVETLDLYCHAAGVVTGGATMAREAALMCKPAISLYPTHINQVLEKMGFPIRNIESVDKPDDIVTILEESRGLCPAEMLSRFEVPSDVLIRVLESI
ncbi:protein of unknown function DUF354 [Pyrolobus fumarii 1A]|uniref:DUF354 domain-containing protein n=1 Tax=Pyrolobus fumarii (strain DSM 11204 / 1A) TaxID=694429 RepID=G0EEH4_PYRF1|nr:DUF354 domain-containing protein [Pyrolobus fumarii]AEM38015.1 protein of unknown function DUF354 [Pyrolobus fumarii 1A]